MSIADALPHVFRWMERTVDYYVPIQRHIRDDVLMLNDGSPFAMIELRGHPFETLDELDVINRFHRLNETYRQISKDGLIFYIWECRGEAAEGFYPTIDSDNPVVQWVDDEYQIGLRNAGLYYNRKFFGVQVREERIATGEFLGEIMAKMSDIATEVEPGRIITLERVITLLMNEFREYKPRRVGVRIEERNAFGPLWTDKLGTRVPVTYSEIAENLVLAATGIWRKVPLTTGPLNQSMFRETISFSGDYMRLIQPDQVQYAAILSTLHFPSSTYPSMMRGFLTAPYCCTVTHSFRCVSTETAKQIMSRKQTKLMAANDVALRQAAALRDAAESIANADYVLGDYALTILAFADSEERLRNVTISAWGHLADAGIQVSREGTMSIEAAWASVFPGNATLRPRPGFINSRNFAAMAPLHSYDTGNRTGFWGKPAAVFQLPSGEPFYYHFHVNDLGSTFLCGPPGSGKTSMLGNLLCSTARVGVRTNVVYDKGRGLKVLIKALGGAYLELGGPCLAPLKRLTGGEDDLGFLADLIRGAIMRDNRGELSPEEDRRLMIGLREIMQLPPPDRWLSEVCGFLGMEPGGAGERLNKWCWSNELGWVFDAPEDKVNFDNWINAFDQTVILDNAYARGPTIATLHYYSLKLLDGRRFAEFFDELNKSMNEAQFVPIIDRAMREIRKFNGITLLATQSPHDVVSNEKLQHVIREMLASAFFFGNYRGELEDYKKMGLNAFEHSIVTQLPPGKGHFLLKQGSKTHLARLPLPDNVVALISGREHETKLFDKILLEQEHDIQSTLIRWHKDRLQLVEAV
jgi:type IV secretion system protein VirB4